MWSRSSQVLIISSALSALCSYLPAAAVKQEYPFPYLDPALPIPVRVANLISLLTLDEKATQLQANASAIPRIDLPSFSWGRECERGDASGGSRRSTAYPEGMALASSFNAPLVWAIALQTAIEVRAHVNDGDGSPACFGPVSNLVRDPRWGRSAEMLAGEDPTLGRVLSRAFTWGIMGGVPGTNPGPNKRVVSSIAKHLNTYGGPEGRGYTFGPFAQRFSFNAILPTEREWRTTFLPAFLGSAEAGTAGFMCSYSSITLADRPDLPSNVPACADSYLLNSIIRGEWGWDGYVLSDAGAVVFGGNTSIGGVPFGHGYAHNDSDAAVKALSGGCDVELTCCGAPSTYWRLPDAVRAGTLAEAQLDKALNRTLPWRFAVGALDPKGNSPYDSLNSMNNATTPAMIDLAMLAAQQSFVLLKNDGTLPVSPASLAGKSVCVIGPNANNTLSLMGGYVNTLTTGIVTVFMGLTDALPLSTVILAQACNSTACPQYSSSAVTAAASCDLNIIVGGLTAYAYSKNESTACGCPSGDAIEGECCDRQDVALPGAQLALVQAIAALGKPTVLVTINAGMLDLSWAQASSNVGSIISGAYPGQTGGAALASVITGLVSPSGRLVTTWYSVPEGGLDAVIGPITYYSMSNRTYKYFTGPVQYPFGYGLSYTTFSYELEGISPQSVSVCDIVNISYAVTNTGSVAGAEVPQLYLSLEGASVPVPPLSLVNFDHLPPIAPGETVHAWFLLLPEDQAVMRDVDYMQQVEPGGRAFWLGAAINDQVAPGVKGSFTVGGTTTPLSACPQGMARQVWAAREPGQGGAGIWAPINLSS